MKMILRPASWSLLLALITAPLLFSGERDAAPSATEIRPLLPGMAIPEVSFKTLEGQPFSLNDAVKEKPVLLIFYRGGW